jgi:hypothetical protein
LNIATYEKATNPQAKAASAILVADMLDHSLAKVEAMRWVERAIEANPTENRKRFLGIVRIMALNRLGVYSDELKNWLETLSDQARHSPLAATMEKELILFEEREEIRQSGYLIH